MKKYAIIKLVVLFAIIMFSACTSDNSIKSENVICESNDVKDIINNQEIITDNKTTENTIETDLINKEKESETTKSEHNTVSEPNAEIGNNKVEENIRLEETTKSEEKESKETVGQEETVKQEETIKQEETVKQEEITSQYIEPYLNREEIVYWYGAVRTGMEYIGLDYIDYSQDFIDLHVYGADSNKVKWESANEKIATVKDGMVTIHNYGKTIITAIVEGKELKCNVNVKKLCPYFYMDYSYIVDDENLTDGIVDHWIWDGTYCMNVGQIVRYKITEKEFDEYGNFVRETDITKMLNLEPLIDNVYEINEKEGTIIARKAGTNQEDMTSDIECVLVENECFRYNDSEKSEKNKIEDRIIVQKMVLKFFTEEKGTYDYLLEINKKYGKDGEFFALVCSEYTGIFTWDEEFVPVGALFYGSSSLNEFDWYSSDECVIKIENAIGSGHYVYGAVNYKIVGSGYTTITVKRGEKIIDEVKIYIDNNLIMYVLQ